MPPSCAACANNIFNVGGAYELPPLAFGTESVAKVFDKISFGSGNAFVTEAK